MAKSAGLTTLPVLPGASRRSLMLAPNAIQDIAAAFEWGRHGHWFMRHVTTPPARAQLSSYRRAARAHLPQEDWSIERLG